MGQEDLLKGNQQLKSYLQKTYDLLQSFREQLAKTEVLGVLRCDECGEENIYETDPFDIETQIKDFELFNGKEIEELLR